jgi:hypothetical protein
MVSVGHALRPVNCRYAHMVKVAVGWAGPGYRASGMHYRSPTQPTRGTVVHCPVHRTVLSPGTSLYPVGC